MTAALEADLWLLSAGVAGPTRAATPRTRRAIALASELGAPVRDVLARQEERARAEATAARALRRATAQGRAAAVGLLAAPPLLAPLVGTLAGTGVRPRGAVLLAAAALWGAGGLVTLLLVRRATAAGRPGASGGAPVLTALGVASLVAGRPGPAVVLTGLALLVARRAARRPGPEPGLDELLELTALALRTGRSAGAALRAAGSAVPGLADAAQRLALWLELGARGTAPALPAVAADLRAAHRSGVPLVPVVEALAARLRADELQARLERAERLPVQLTVPLALLLLPAALLLVLAPLAELALAPLG